MRRGEERRGEEREWSDTEGTTMAEAEINEDEMR